MNSDRQPFLGYDVFSGDPSACTASVVAWIRGGSNARWLACLNPHSFVTGLDHPAFAAALKSADWLVPDGVGVTLLSGLLRLGLPARVTGSDVFDGVSRELNATGGARVFFLGSTESVLAAICVRYRKDYPNLHVAGALSPPFRAEYSDLELASMAAAINAAKPDVLWVGLGAPKQEMWIHRILPRIHVRFAAAIGAVFDFYSGRVPRAHPVLRRLGLEWLPRLLREPLRLWRRTLVSAPLFTWHALRYGLSRRLRHADDEKGIGKHGGQ